MLALKHFTYVQNKKAAKRIPEKDRLCEQNCKYHIFRLGESAPLFIENIFHIKKTQ